MASSHLERPRHETKDPIVHATNRASWIDARNRIIAASLATVVGEILIAPTNIIKQKQMEFVQNQANKTALPSMMQMARNVMNEQGYGGFFHGFSSILFKQIGYKSLVLLCYDPFRNQLYNWKTKMFSQSSTIRNEPSQIASKLKDKIEQSTILHSYNKTSKTIPLCLLAGGLSGMVGYSIMHPQQALSSSKSSMATQAGTMRYLSKPNLMYIFLIYATEFGGYDYLKSYILNYSTMAANYTVWPVYVLSASTMGIISALISVPADILRARAMNTVKNSEGMLLHVMNTINQEGGYAFRRKLMLNMTRKVLWLSGFFLTYEEVKRYLDINYSKS